MRRIFLIDCPGVVYPSEDSESDIVLKGVVRVIVPPHPTHMHAPTLLICFLFTALLWLHPSCLIPRSKWKRSVTQRITSTPFWSEQKPNTYRKPITSHPGALLRISWKNWPFARENCSRCGFWLWLSTRHAKVQFQLDLFTRFLTVNKPKPHTLLHASGSSRTHTRVLICLSGYVGFYSRLLMKTCF